MSLMVLHRISLLLIIIILGVIDLATGYEYSFAVFYLIPVSIAAWYDNKHIAMIAVIFRGLLGYMLTIVQGTSIQTRLSHSGMLV